MPLNESEIELVKRTLALVLPVSHTTSALFYGRLFIANPQLRLLFKHDIASQHLKFIATLAALVDALDNPDTLMDLTARLGAGHRSYHVHDEHYVLAGEAFIWSLRQVLTLHFTPEVEVAWTKLYFWVADLMRSTICS